MSDRSRHGNNSYRVGEERVVDRRFIIDFRRIYNAMKNDSNLWIARNVMEIPELIAWLLEEPPIPREYPAPLDAISDYINKRTDLIEKISPDTLDIIAIQLDMYQRELDAEITHGVTSDLHSFEYEVVKWIGKTTALIAVSSFDERRYPLVNFRNL